MFIPSKMNLISSSHILPREYTRVNYIESDGHCIIDTGVYPADDVQFETKVRFTGAYGDDPFCSLRRDGGDSRYYLLNMNNVTGMHCCKNTWRPSAYVYSGSTTNTKTITSRITTEYVFISVETDDGIFNSSKEYISGSNWWHTSLPLFGAKYPYVAYAPSGARCWYARFIVNGQLVRNLIPVLDKTGTPCMYDLITQRPFYNQGSGNFTYLQLPMGYTELEYLESTGKQIINLGLYPEQFSEVKLVLAQTDIPKAREYFFGSGNGFDGAIGYESLQYAYNIKTKTISDNYTTLVGSPYRKYLDRDVWLFARNVRENNKPVIDLETAPSSIKLNSLQVKQGNNLVIDILPCLDQNGIPCVYDKVSKRTLYDEMKLESFRYKIS